MAAQVDHIVLLVPHSTLLSPPEWISTNFTISPGGRHGDNKTENKLIVFRDGSYIELIAFIDDLPEHRQGHWWDKPFGIVDYAFTSQGDPDVACADVQGRLEGNSLGVGYADPKSGSRLREDGKRISWKVTFPTGVGRGEVPFWCHDLTPRERRVPTDKVATTHPCGAVGVAALTTAVPNAKLDDFIGTYAAVIGARAHGHGNTTVTFNVDSVTDVGGQKPKVQVSTPNGEKEVEAVATRGAVILEIELKVEDPDSAGKSFQIDENGLQCIRLAKI